MKRFLSKLGPGILVIITGFLAYWQVLSGFFSLKWDNIDFFLPSRNFFVDSIRSGDWAAWNPSIFLGYPALSDPQGGAWYPILWLFSLFGEYDAQMLNLEWLFHVIVAGLGMSYLGRSIGVDRWISALMGMAFLCSGFFVGTAQILSFVIGATWIPWVIASWINWKKGYSRKHMLLLIVFLYFALTGSYPAMTILLTYFLVVVGLRWMIKRFIIKKDLPFKSPGIQLILAFVSLLLLSSGHLLSIMEASPLVGRGTGMEARDVLFTDSFGLHSYLTIFFPYSSTGDFEWFGTDASMINAFVGVAIFGVGIIGSFNPKNRVFNVNVLFWVALCLLLGLSKELPLRRLFHEYLPGFDLFRHPGIFRLYFIFGMILLFGKNFNWVLSNHLKRLILVSFISAVALIALFIHGFPEWISVAGLIDNWPYLDEFDTLGIASRISIQAFYLLILAFLWMMTLLIYPKHPKAQTFILILIPLELILAVQLNTNTTICNQVSTNTIDTRLEEMPEQWTLPLDLPLMKYANDSINIEIPTIWRNESMFLKRLAPDGYNPFQLISFNELEKSEEWKKVLQSKFFSKWNNDNWQALSPDQFEIKSYKPDRLEFEVELHQPSRIQLLQNKYPHWELMLNGQPQTLNGDAQLISFDLPAGSNKVVLNFNKSTYIIGGLTTLFGWILLLIGVVFIYRNKKTS